MSKRHFKRYGRTCPVDCKERCCVICEFSDGAIEFIPTRPVFQCKNKEAERHPEYKEDEGLNCKCFSKADIPEEHIIVA